MRWYKDSKIKDKLETLLFAFVFLFLSMIFFFEATESLLMLESPDNIVVEYQGEFEVNIIKYVRNISYLFILNNGDKVSIPAEFINKEKDVKFNKKCVFKYSKCFDFRGWHDCLSISSLDGVELLKEKEVRHGYGGSIIFYYLISLMLLLCSLFFLCFVYGDKIYKSVKRQQRKKKKSKTR